MPRRRGRPGLVGTMARTAVVAGTATAVVGAVGKHQAQGQAPAAAPEAAPQAAPEPQAAEDDPMAQIQQLADMHAKGLLTDDEFSAAKAKALGI